MSNKTTAELVIYLAYQVEHAFGDQDKIDKAITEAEKAIKAYAVEARTDAVRKDRKANTEFWKSNIDKMFDREIATYKQQLKEKK